MNNGFTLMETLVSMVLLLVAVLFSSRIIVSILGQTKQAGLRFRLVEQLDFYKNYLSSLGWEAPELTLGPHEKQEREFRIAWRVEAAGPFLKRIRLAVSWGPLVLPLVLQRSRFIGEVAR
ncbi:MAG: prepilin-type N-terminal cleavage/methylation domain-containing protein [Candidatus Aminicenantes bacterium]|nr:prepilin-type N-terminal cleavage/methylation domain-containing protein [Candidatus Aminicenantes bacterium]